jgi:hypothetical protein
MDSENCQKVKTKFYKPRQTVKIANRESRLTLPLIRTTNRNQVVQNGVTYLVTGLMKPEPFPLRTPIMTMITSLPGYIFLQQGHVL